MEYVTRPDGVGSWTKNLYAWVGGSTVGNFGAAACILRRLEIREMSVAVGSVITSDENIKVLEMQPSIKLEVQTKGLAGKTSVITIKTMEK